VVKAGLFLSPLYKAILEALKVQAREHISKPAMDKIEKVITQSMILFLMELTSKAPKKAKENPATRALIKADCLQISA
jgi:hypothetical protein